MEECNDGRSDHQKENNLLPFGNLNCILVERPFRSNKAWGKYMKIETSVVMETYKDSLFSVAFNLCQNAADAEDVVQDTFLQYYMESKPFMDAQHIRAWLIRVTINKAKNVNQSFWRRKSVPLEEYMETLTFETPEAENLFGAVMTLPEKYRIVIHLFYYEDYSAKEIAEILHITEANVKVRLSRGRKLLKEKLEDIWNDEE